MNNTEFFLEHFSRIYPLSHCFWRIPEATAELGFFPLLHPPLLDLGCGDGTYTRILLERASEIFTTNTYSPLIGLDPNPEERVKATKSGIYSQIFTTDSSNIPLPDASVNSVFSNSVVEHIKDKNGAIKEISRVLTPGGTYLFSTPSPDMAADFKIAKLLSRNGGEKLKKIWVRVINTKFKHYWIQSPEKWSEDLNRYGLKTQKYCYTLSPQNAALWELFLLPSYIQHLFAKKFGAAPLASVTKRYLQKHLSELTEDPNMKTGGNLVILAQKT